MSDGRKQWIKFIFIFLRFWPFVHSNQNSNPPGCSECRDALNHTIANNLINILSDLSKFKIYSNSEKVIRVIGSSKFKRPIFQRDAITWSHQFYKQSRSIVLQTRFGPKFVWQRQSKFWFERPLHCILCVLSTFKPFFSGSWRQRLFND